MPIKVVKNEAAKRGEVMIYDFIGKSFWDDSGVSAKGFAQEIKALGDVQEIVVRINSPGGDVWDGLAIYNTLNQHPARKIVEIEGLAASAASFIAMAGDEIRMAENGIMMIHCAHFLTMGNRADHEKGAEVLAKHDEQIAGTYARRSGKDASYFMALMEEETWMSAKEAREHGLVTQVVEGKSPQACVGEECAKRFRNAPERLKLFFKPAASVGGKKKEKTMCDSIKSVNDRLKAMEEEEKEIKDEEDTEEEVKDKAKAETDEEEVKDEEEEKEEVKDEDEDEEVKAKKKAKAKKAKAEEDDDDPKEEGEEEEEVKDEDEPENEDEDDKDVANRLRKIANDGVKARLAEIG